MKIKIKEKTAKILCMLNTTVVGKQFLGVILIGSGKTELGGTGPDCCEKFLV